MVGCTRACMQMHDEGKGNVYSFNASWVRVQWLDPMNCDLCVYV